MEQTENRTPCTTNPIFLSIDRSIHSTLYKRINQSERHHDQPYCHIHVMGTIGVRRIDNQG